MLALFPPPEYPLLTNSYSFPKDKTQQKNNQCLLKDECWKLDFNKKDTNSSGRQKTQHAEGTHSHLQITSVSKLEVKIWLLGGGDWVSWGQGTWQV